MLLMDKLIYMFQNLRNQKILMIKRKLWFKVYLNQRETQFGCLKISIRELVLEKELYSYLIRIEITALNAIC